MAILARILLSCVLAGLLPAVARAELAVGAMAEFETLRTSVIGISTDTIETQREFSRMACRDKFPVAADPEGNVAKAYDALAGKRGGGNVIARRTSYVVTPDGRIASALTAGDAESHIRSALASVKAWKARQGH